MHINNLGREMHENTNQWLYALHMYVASLCSLFNILYVVCIYNPEITTKLRSC